MKVDQDSGAITLDVPNFDQLHQQLKALEDSGKINGIAVVSVAGAFRKGKSFLLDLFIHYLSKPAGSQNGSLCWNDDGRVGVGVGVCGR